MVQSKELIQLYNAYKKDLGTYTDASTAAYMVMAHCMLDLKRTIQSFKPPTGIEKFENANPEMKTNTGT